jgi:hypothetical protein
MFFTHTSKYLHDITFGSNAGDWSRRRMGE